MTKEKKKKEVPPGRDPARGGEEGIGFDFGIGSLFKGIGKLIDLAAELEERGGEIKKEGEIDLSHLKEGMKGVFGFSIKTMEGGRHVVEPFGNIKKTPKGPKVEEEREPITDVFDEKENVVVIAEMPGINEEAISLDLKDDILEIKAASKDRKYHKEVLLPVPQSGIKAGNLTSSYTNGILKVVIKKC